MSFDANRPPIPAPIGIQAVKIPLAISGDIVMVNILTISVNYIVLI